MLLLRCLDGKKKFIEDQIPQHHKFNESANIKMHLLKLVQLSTCEKY